MSNYTSALETSEHVRAKVSALRAIPELVTIESAEAGTVETKTKEGKLIFSAIQKGGAGSPWITRQMKGLFTRVS